MIKIAFCGHRRVGKTTAANFFAGRLTEKKMRIQVYDMHKPATVLLDYLGIKKRKIRDKFIQGMYTSLGRDIFWKAFQIKRGTDPCSSFIVDNVFNVKEYENLVNDGFITISMHKDKYHAEVKDFQYMRPNYSLYNFGSKEELYDDLEILVHRVLIDYGY